MATKEMRICDVTGSTKDVREVYVVMRSANTDGCDDELLAEWSKDLTPQSVERWKKFIDRGCTPPAPRAKK